MQMLMTMTEYEFFNTVERMIVEAICRIPALPIGDNIVLSEN